MAAPVKRLMTGIVTDIEQSGDGWLKLSAPAKVNLMLSVHGRREDGFHELTSVVAALAFGDELELRINNGDRDRLTSDGLEIPLDESNLVLRAAQLFREATGRSECFDFRLKKNIPVGAGLGGGSSDGVAALKGMNALLSTCMDGGQLRELAARLGSDCPFFVDGQPSLMRGRGEQIEPLDEEAARRLSGRRIALFRPSFGIHTGWAYSQLVAMPEFYEDATVADARLDSFSKGGHWSAFLHNTFEDAVGRKFLALPCLLEKLRMQGYDCMMSGSGSACFALIDSDAQVASMKVTCLQCWGENIFWVETTLIGRKMT